MVRANNRVCVVAVCVGLLGCGDAPERSLELRWGFNDGRDCAAAGVESVEIAVFRERELVQGVRGSCLEGYVDAIVIDALSDGFYEVYGEGLSSEGSLLYSGQEVVLVSGATATLALVLAPAGEGR